MSIELNQESAKLIALAILEQAVSDYYGVLTGRIHSEKNNRYCNKIELEKFFQSDYFIALTGGEIDGTAAMESLQRKAEEHVPLKIFHWYN